MKKLFYPSLMLLSGICLIFIFISCDKKLNDPNAIQPTNKTESTGTGANPNIGVVTVTGTSTLTNPATQNTSIYVGGGACWTYNSCVATTTNTGSSELVAHCGSTIVDITFGTPPPIGNSNYTLVSGTPTGMQARMVIGNAPGQPTGINWYSKSGMLSVSTGTNLQTTATFTNIQCLQNSFLFPVVTASGNMTCI